MFGGARSWASFCENSFVTPQTVQWYFEYFQRCTTEHTGQMNELQPQVRELVARAETLGRAMYRFDQVAAVASDALNAKTGGPDQRVSGWVVTDNDGLTAHFLGDAGTRELYRVRLATIESTHVSGPARALASAQKILFPRIAAPYNPVVLPASIIWGDRLVRVHAGRHDEARRDVVRRPLQNHSFKRWPDSFRSICLREI